MFITFEGIDGSGKSTQIKLLENYLDSTKLKYISVREPGGTQFSEQIRTMLLNSNYLINSISELMLFEAARSDLVEKVITTALESNEIVIADRFYDSTTAYQGYGRQLNIDYINILNQLAVGNCIPDITFLLNLPIDIAQNRINHLELDRMEKSSFEFYQRVYSGFLEIAKQNTERIAIINSNQDKDKTFKDIMAILHNNFPSYFDLT